MGLPRRIQGGAERGIQRGAQRRHIALGTKTHGPASTYSASGMPITLTALATAADKASHPALLQLAAELQLPITPVNLPQLASQAAAPSAHVPARYGAHSVAEAAALAAVAMAVQAEPVKAQLLTPRCTSPDRLATAAIAFSENIRP